MTNELCGYSLTTAVLPTNNFMHKHIFMYKREPKESKNTKLINQYGSPKGVQNEQQGPQIVSERS